MITFNLIIFLFYDDNGGTFIFFIIYKNKKFKNEKGNEIYKKISLESGSSMNRF